MPYSYGDGRVWFQRNEFEPFEILLPYGMTGVNDPKGALTAVREPSASKRRESVIVDALRSEPGFPEFTLETRLARTLNYLFGLDCAINVQCHMGRCDRPDNYNASEVGLDWNMAHRGDMSLDRLAKIEGDNAPTAVSVPFNVEMGPLLLDFLVEFLSARTISEDQTIVGLAALESECLEDCQTQRDAGEVVYAAAAPEQGEEAVIHYSVDDGDNFTACSANPFGSDEELSNVVVLGKSDNHRIIVARASTDAGEYAEIAYAEVTTPGTTAWVTVDVGSVAGQYINKILALDWAHVYAVTDDGYIYRSKDGGETWTAIRSGGAGLHDIRGMNWGRNAGMLVAVGDANTILLSLDYGETWTSKTGPTGAYADNLSCCEVKPNGTIFVGNTAGEIYGSYDRCANWTTLSLGGITPTDINDIKAWGNSVVWVAANIAGPAGRVLRSTDGGATFRLWDLNMPTNTGIECLALVNQNVCLAGGAAAFITRAYSNLYGY